MMLGIIIVAAGRGERFGGEVPKQFCMLGEKQVVEWSIEAFRETLADAKIVVVVPSEYADKVSYDGAIVTAGGATRSESVRRGLEALGETDLVAIHDGARPYISPKLIERCIEEAQEFGSAIPVVEVVDSLRWIDGGALDRGKVCAVQTPQVFRGDILRKAYRETKGEFTDDATLVEAAGYGVHLCEGDPKNIKITRQEDLG